MDGGSIPPISTSALFVGHNPLNKRAIRQLVALLLLKSRCLKVCFYCIFLLREAGENGQKTQRRRLSETWAGIVGETDPTEFQKHLKAGTAIDFATGSRSTDPKRIVVYFLKHSSPTENGQKDYQNQPPDFWKAAGSVGRFWGRWGLEVATTTIEISEDQAKFVARVLRRWSRANNKPRKVNVWRVNQATGEMRKRRVNRRSKRMPKTQGFCYVNDGSLMGEALALALRSRFGAEAGRVPPIDVGPRF